MSTPSQSADAASALSGATEAAAARLSTGYTWSECPRWHDGAFWFSDLYHHRILKLGAGGSPENVFEKACAGRPTGAVTATSFAFARVPRPACATSQTHSESVIDFSGRTSVNGAEAIPGGFGWLPDGRMIVTSMHERPCP